MQALLAMTWQPQSKRAHLEPPDWRGKTYHYTGKMIIYIYIPNCVYPGAADFVAGWLLQSRSLGG